MLTDTEMLQAAVSLFREKSFYGTTLGEIAQVLDVRASMLNSVLGTKQDMLWAAVSRIAALLHSYMSSAPEMELASEQLYLTLYRSIEVAVSENDYFVVFNRDWSLLEGERRSRIQTQRQAYEEYMRGIISKGMRQGLFVIPDSYSGCFFALNSLQWSYAWNLVIDTPAFADYARHYCLSILRGLGYDEGKTPA